MIRRTLHCCILLSIQIYSVVSNRLIASEDSEKIPSHPRGFAIKSYTSNFQSVHGCVHIFNITWKLPQDGQYLVQENTFLQKLYCSHLFQFERISILSIISIVNFIKPWLKLLISRSIYYLTAFRYEAWDQWLLIQKWRIFISLQIQNLSITDTSINNQYNIRYLQFGWSY